MHQLIELPYFLRSSKREDDACASCSFFSVTLPASRFDTTKAASAKGSALPVDVYVMTHFMPAAVAAFRPTVESSMTMHSLGCRPSLAHAVL